MGEINRRVVIINGSAASGKDEIVKMAISITEDTGIDVFNFSTVDAVKDACRILGCSTDQKTEAARQFWSDVKDAWTRYNDGPFMNTINRIQIATLYTEFPPKCFLFFVHCREPKEIQKFKTLYGDQCTTLLVRRHGVKVPGNHADQNVESYQYDKIIENDGTLDDLKHKVINFIKEVTHENLS